MNCWHAHPRDVSPDHFTASTAVPENSHVLLLDDTWTSGGHAQSATLALRAAGAAHVSVLVIGRWLNPRYGNNAQFVRDRLTTDCNPEICPWTGAGCP